MRDLVSDDGHSAMVQYQPVGTYDEAALYIDKLTAAVDKTAAEHKGFEVNQLGSVTHRRRRPTRPSTAC